MHTGKIIIAVVLLLGLTVPVGAGAAGWVEENGTWVFRNKDGSEISDEWKKAPSKKYFYEEDFSVDEDSWVKEGSYSEGFNTDERRPVPGPGTSDIRTGYQQLIVNDSPVIPITVTPSVDPALAALAEKLAGKLDPSQLAQLPALLNKALNDGDVKTLRTVLGKLGPDQTAQLLNLLQSGQTPDIKTLTDMATAAGVTTGEILSLGALVGNLKKSPAGQELLALLKDIGGAFSSVSLPETLNAEAGNLFQGVLELVLALRDASVEDVDKLVAALQKLDGDALANLLQALAQANPEQVRALLASLFQGDTAAALTLANTILGVTGYAVYDPNTDTNVYYPTPEAAEAASRVFWAEYRKNHPSATPLYFVVDDNFTDMRIYKFLSNQTADGFKQIPNARVSGTLTDTHFGPGGNFGFDVNLGSGSITNAGMNFQNSGGSFDVRGGSGQANGGSFTINDMRGTMQVSTTPSVNAVGGMSGTEINNFSKVEGSFQVDRVTGATPGSPQFEGTFSGGKQ